MDYLDQPPLVTFRWPDGSKGEHTFDALLTLKDTTRVAVDVKPKTKVQKSRILEVQRLIEEQIGKAFADVYLLRTEDHIHPDDVYDARMLLRARRLACAASDAVVAKLVGGLHGWCRLRDLVAVSGIGGNAFNAAVRLIGDGMLEVRDCARVSYECFVRRARA
ncbi:hypothetical protein [Mesorhizobium sp. CAU 1732]|uniref:hypothetical protein n=1 Tax=Mesorhizobium sp. CAU 1732 TaxID=3140358 RepID=UPI0032616688